MRSSQSGPSSVQASRDRVIRTIATSSTSADAGSASAIAEASSAPMTNDAVPASAPMTNDAAQRPANAIPVLDDGTPVIGLIDLDHIAETYALLTSAFSGAADVLHAVACKAVPLQPLLRSYAEAGAGCEVASPGELELALSAGFSPEAIVFDSPAKTWTELRRAVDLGVSMNIDNFDELERLDVLLTGHTTSARVGIRINPQSGTGTIGALSTATQTSKFGIGLADPGARDELIEAYLSRPWLNQIHVHSGSQGISLDQAAAGIETVVDLAKEVNELAAQKHGRDRQITRIDIGGGLPVNFSGEEITPTFAEYRAVLEARVPELFDFDLVTEFGRALLAKAGTTLTHVEYAKTTGGRRIAMTHAGVQVATRTAYAPADWPLRILPFTPEGNPKTAEVVPTDVAGPACFAGDLLVRDRMLPRLDAGDIVAVPDTGAYYFSNPFSYNLLPRVPVYGYRVQAETVEFSIIRRGQTTAEVLAETGEPEIAGYRLVPYTAGG
ncbi:diaminopimelate decarboxylase [Brevibacterium aurantiacum]|uniref:Diaminopimelate decarboxylase n=2 Tax=Brevibacterium aurantiacum TaxID=273384 RepID=A0A2A3ZQN2_BREAU|nr:diaminopimelate decarboxylase [Brevibacterium aurantiacum]MDN5586778.1 diaminopimelate decarboxylase [Brevibacterium sp.]PCC53864.1 diaminopimelate decarboxylase [Brevibacterium aurantiacum]SMX77425.1 diaminopimelate decarboxylase [Brevibacterium aurantiacum]